VLDLDEFGSAGRVATWDGRDESGRELPAGVYFLRAETSGDGRSAGKVVLLR
jgi:flagellar hook assembly protein FlgD